MGALVDLKELSIGFDEQVPDLGVTVPNTTIKFIAMAKNIESLSLFSGESYLDGFTVPYISNAQDIMSRLSSHRFPHLRKLHIGPLCRQIPLRFFTLPAFGVWRFTRNQKQLREVDLCVYETSSDWSRMVWSISPHGMWEDMPSMRRFEGPARDTPTLLRLNLARRLEVLDLTHVEPPKSGALSDLLQELRRVSHLEFPCLRELKVSIGDQRTPDNNERAINVAGILASAAPELEELVFRTCQPPTKYNQECLLEVLTKLQKLPRLGLPKGWFRGLSNMSHTESFFNRVKALCPGLFIVDDPSLALAFSAKSIGARETTNLGKLIKDPGKNWQTYEHEL
ncbi:hypothetical protein B0J17DRAFT_117465 [Rhizoctonia solani]|nr:hypothetical protein B0J17DRAFT_117465 [Rhizoctonia solani]